MVRGQPGGVPMTLASIGLQMLAEDVRALAGKLGGNADRYAWTFYERTVDELTQQEMGQLKVELTELLSQGEKRMSAQTNTGTAAQPQKAAEIPNIEAYSTNFYFDMQVEGQNFAGQMTVRGGLNGPDHLHRVLGAMKVVVQNGGVAKGPRGQQAQGSAPAASNGSGFEWTKGDKGRNMLVLRGGAAEPESVPCPVCDGKTLKRRTGADGDSWLSH